LKPIFNNYAQNSSMLKDTKVDFVAFSHIRM
jgi:hypothetical protein